MTRNRLALVGLLMLTMTLAACSDRSAPPAASEIHTYTVRGQIMQLPGDQSVDQQMLIRHEAIPDFTDSSGKVVGMMSMTMPFPVAPGVALTDLKTGDLVRFTFELNWQAKSDSPYRITKIEKLPADTQLQFGPADMKEMKDMPADHKMP